MLALAKLLMDAMYVAVLVGILVLYFIIDHLLIYRIRQMVPAEVLKNRE